MHKALYKRLSDILSAGGAVLGSLSGLQEAFFSKADYTSAEKAEARCLLKLWKLTGIHKPSFSPNTKRAWQRVRPQTKPTYVLFFRRRRVYGAAALLLIALGLYGIYTGIYTRVSESTPTAHTVTYQADAREAKALVLADGSKVWLRHGAVLEQNTAFGQKNRRLRLTGEAYFEVKEAKHPFDIQTPHLLVRVRGTAFHINHRPQHTSLAVLEGVVEAKALQFSESPVRLQARESIRCSNTALARTSWENENFLAWKTKRLQFTKTPLREVLRQLGDFHHTSIQLSASRFGDCLVTTTFHKNSLEEALSILATLTQGTYLQESEKEETPQRYRFTPRRCE